MRSFYIGYQCLLLFVTDPDFIQTSHVEGNGSILYVWSCHCFIVCYMSVVSVNVSYVDIWTDESSASIFPFNFMKVWDFETIDTADSVDDTGLLEMEHMNELLVGKNVNLSFMMKIHDHGQPVWYAQVTHNLHLCLLNRAIYNKKGDDAV